MITVERVKPEEISEVKKLLSDTWVDTYSGFVSQATIDKVTSTWHSSERLAQQAQNADIYFAVAKNNEGKIVGLTTARTTDDDAIFMSRLYVDPSQQRQGIGKLLFDSVVDTFKSAKKIRLEVEEQNKKGKDFYESQGFKEISRKDEEVGSDTLKTIVMEKTL